MTFYLCTGENPICKDSNGCFMNGGNCHHTANDNYRKTEKCNDPQRHPERFEAEVFPNSSMGTYYFERLETYDEKEQENDELD